MGTWFQMQCLWMGTWFQMQCSVDGHVVSDAASLASNPKFFQYGQKHIPRARARAYNYL